MTFEKAIFRDTEGRIYFYTTDEKVKILIDASTVMDYITQTVPTPDTPDQPKGELTRQIDLSEPAMEKLFSVARDALKRSPAVQNRTGQLERHITRDEVQKSGLSPIRRESE